MLVPGGKISKQRSRKLVFVIRTLGLELSRSRSRSKSIGGESRNRSTSKPGRSRRKIRVQFSKRSMISVICAV